MISFLLLVLWAFGVGFTAKMYAKYTNWDDTWSWVAALLAWPAFAAGLIGWQSIQWVGAWWHARSKL
jgi:hypothetical protein